MSSPNLSLGEGIFIKEEKCFQIVEIRLFLHFYGLDSPINKQALLSQKWGKLMLCLQPKKGKTVDLWGEFPGVQHGTMATI